jgi:hypothetical protein
MFIVKSEVLNLQCLGCLLCHLKKGCGTPYRCFPSHKSSGCKHPTHSCYIPIPNAQDEFGILQIYPVLALLSVSLF